MEESDGVFAKRRRNLFIVGVVIIILAVANPDLSNLKLFDIEFNFEGRVWMIWFGLLIWFIYVCIRAYTYYNTFIHEQNVRDKNKFIFWDKGGSVFWRKMYNKSCIDLGNNYNDNYFKRTHRRLKKTRVRYQGNLDDVLIECINNGDIPGKIRLIFEVEHEDGLDNMDEVIEFKEDPEMIDYFKRRKVLYATNDNWWEYTFLFVFVGVAILSLAWAMIRNYWGI